MANWSMPYWFDGNNLIGKSAAEARNDRKTCREFLRQLSGLSTARGGRFLVYFDGDAPDRSAPPRGVQVRYSAPLSTDGVILQKLAGTRNPAEVIVVTNDSGLRSACRDAGAKTMTWAEFTHTVRKKPGLRNRHQDREEPISVDEWARFFGLDEESLE